MSSIVLYFFFGLMAFAVPVAHALVMATGVVSIACHLLGVPLVPHALLLVNWIAERRFPADTPWAMMFPRTSCTGGSGCNSFSMRPVMPAQGLSCSPVRCKKGSSD